ncbi:unnamed protein product [Hyaloperonospora brassicae]|uniref:RxLR effector candidate protein n=1 Tax=Hyaloperonospora brassicae TaxID=162125 RepID=A0AAV0U1D6_HYABA|nr:unnamed protein product [Hyaloperonospora brassicae]
MSASAVAAAPPAASVTASSTSISISDDERLFTSGSSANSSSDGPPPVPYAKGGCPRAVQRRFRRVRHCLTHVSITFPVRRAASGLTVIAALLMVGIVGTFALRQMMSPEIEALTQQRERLKHDVTVLRLQVENMTRIAESRLETIHLLETELERQHVQAAEAAAIATPGTKHGADSTVPYNDLKNGESHPGRTLPTIVFSLLLGSIVLASVLYRIFFIIRGEIVWQQAFRKRKYANGNVATDPMMSMTMESPLDGKRNGRRTPPLSPTRNLDIDDPQTNGHQNAVSNPSVSPKAKSELSPQCYKRAPGSSPTVV